MESPDRLGTMPVARLLVSMSVPMMVSFFIQALYNIVDSMFVARISEEALTAVSLAFPLQQAVTAIAVGTGVGINALVPRALGKGDRTLASRIACTAVFLCLGYVAVFLVLGSTMPARYYRMQTDVEEIVRGGATYLSIVLALSSGVFFGQVFEKLLVASGHPLLAMLSQASGAVFNLVFDPLLIFGIGPFPRLGIAGAAIATVLGQLLGAAIAFVLDLKKNPSIRFRPSWIRPDLPLAAAIYRVGFPSMITIGLSSAMSFCVNQILLGYTTTATAVFGIWMKLQNFCFMPVFGMNNGMVPILAYNQGAGASSRVRDTIAIAWKGMVALMLALLFVFEAIPSVVLDLFDAGPSLRAIGLSALRICCLSLPFGASTVILTSSMQALGRSRYTLVVNVLRQFVVLAGMFLILHLLFGRLEVLWWAVPATEAGCAVLAWVLERRMVGELGI